MTITSYTGTIDTKGEFKSIASLTGITFSSGTSYTMQIQNMALLKIGDAVFTITVNEPFTYTAGEETLYMKTCYGQCVLTVLENS